LSNSKDKSKISGSVCAVIPFYNEKPTLYKVLNKTTKYVHFAIAVNDGLNDDAYLNERKNSEIKLIDLEKKYGK